VVELLPLHFKVKGLSPAAAAGIWRDKRTTKKFFEKSFLMLSVEIIFAKQTLFLPIFREPSLGGLHLFLGTKFFGGLCPVFSN
jgi:hypothetical protein